MSQMRRVEGESCQCFLERLSQENRDFYESDRGKGALKDLQQKFPHAWLYVAELIQNAVDEKATTIRLEIIDDKTLVLEHNGEAFDYDKDVIGLCTKGVSSKGAGTVGFMGVGFKAVFRSYETVRISSGDWKFHMKVNVSVGKVYDDKHRNWLGAVLPIWDNSIPSPSEGMTCRFELTDRVVENHTIESDLEAVFKEDKALLPLLARQNIQELDWNGIKWVLAVDKTIPFVDGTGNQLHITALSTDNEDTFSWIIFSQEYTPSRDAIRKFLEHRQLSASTPEEENKIYSDASRTRKVEAFFAVNDEFFPQLPDRGEAYALLPTSVKLPIGINIQADWLLTQSRQEFMDADLKDNPWHREIIECIPKITKQYFYWVSGDDGPMSGTWQNVYKILPSVDKSAIESFGWFLGNGSAQHEPHKLEYCRLLCNELRDIEFVALHISDEQFNFISPSIARVLPKKLSLECGEKLELLPWVLFGENIASRHLLGENAVFTLISIGLLKEIEPQELAEYWSNGFVKSWYENFEADVREQRLEALLHGLFEMDEREDWENTPLNCIPSESGDFIARQSAIRYPSDWNIIVGNSDFVAAFKPFIAAQGEIVAWSLTSRLQYMKTKAKDYIETINQVELSEIINNWWTSLEDDFDKDLISNFTAYICEKFPLRKELIKKVICLSEDQEEILCSLNKALLAEPYARSYRKVFFPDSSVVSDCYYSSNNTLNWRAFFESCNPPTIGRFIPKTFHHKMTDSTYRIHFPDSKKYLRASYMSPISWKRDETIKINNDFFHFIDFKFDQPISSLLDSGLVDQSFSEWINEDIGQLRNFLNKYMLYVPYNCGHIQEDKQPETANWIQKLNNCKWIYSKKSNDGPYKPQDVLKSHDPVRPEAPVADLSHDLIQLLESAGIKFGTQIPKAGPMQKLQIQGSNLSPSELSDVIEEILNEDDPENEEPLRRILESKPLIPVPAGTNLLDGSRRVSFSRIVKKVGPGFRSNLGWIIAVSDLKADNSILKTFEMLKDIYEFPPKTTANQAIDFLEWVWGQKPDAELVRRFLPFSYAYITEEIDSDDEIETRWSNALSKAVVYTLGRQWVSVNGDETIYFNDLQITDFKIVSKQQLVTPSHLASSDLPEQQQASAHLLGISLLSDDYQIKAEEGISLSPPVTWLQNFTDIQKVTLEVLKIEDFDNSDESENIDTESDKKQNLGLKRLDSLAKKIVRLSDNEVLDTKPVYAIQKGNDALVCGEPEDFSGELCSLLISYYNADRKKNIVLLISEMTSLLTCIDRPNFAAQLEKFKKKFDIETPAEQMQDGSNKQSDEPVDDPNQEDNSEEKEAEPTEDDQGDHHEGNNSEAEDQDEEKPEVEDSSDKEENDDSEDDDGSTSGDADDKNSSRPGSGGKSAGNNGNNSDGLNNKSSQQNKNGAGNQSKTGGSEDKPPSKPGDGKSKTTTGNEKPHKRTNRLLSYVAGESTASDDDYPISDDESPETIQIGRAAESFVIEFEKQRGWSPCNMNDKSENHQGYDIESTSPEGRLIYIEVKGINGPWTNVGVGLSAAQFKYASIYKDDYYLYVVENALSPDNSKVYRIENPVQLVTKFQFDHGWKNIALTVTEEIIQPEPEIHHFVGQRVKIVPMGNKEGIVREVTEKGKFMLLSITLDDGEEIQRMHNPLDIKFI